MRFRKRVKMFPGFYLNFSNTGVSSTVGVKGASVTFSKRGTYLNTGIPGAGISHRQRLDHSSSSTYNLNNYSSPHVGSESSSALNSIAERPGEIKSADRESLTSASLEEMRDIIQEAVRDRQELTEEIQQIKKKLAFARTLKLTANLLLIGLIIKWFGINVAEKEDYLTDLQIQYDNAKVDIDISLNEQLKQHLEHLTSAFQKLCQCHTIWDVTSQVANDSVTTRSAATAAITRTKVTFQFGTIPVIKSESQALNLQNANGDDLYIYPAFVVLTKNKTELALINLDELQMEYGPQGFIEEELVPSDAKRVGQTWAKVNKNGTPDKRFAGNYQIPIVEYGKITLRSNRGLNEAYNISNAPNAEYFVGAFKNYQDKVVTQNKSH